MLETESDLDGYVDALGVPVKFRGREFSAILDNETQESDLGPVAVSTNVPVISFPTHRTPYAFAVEGLVVIDGATYVVKEIQPDALGWTTARLIEQQ